MSHMCPTPCRPSILMACLLATVLALTSLPAAADIISVTTTVDEFGSGADCSLREAVHAANEDLVNFGGCARGLGSDLILLPAGTYTFTIAPTGGNDASSGDLQVTEELDIFGIGAAATVILDADNLDRHFEVMESAQELELKNMTLRNGEPGGDGGSIRTDEASSLILENVILENNSAWSGGAIRVHAVDPGESPADPVLDFTDVILQNNDASQYGGAVLWQNGGSGARWNCLRCSFLDNHGSSGGGAAVFYSDDFATITFEDSEIRGNSTLDTLGGGLEVGANASLAIHLTSVELHDNGGVGQFEDGFLSRSEFATLFTNGGSFSDLVYFYSGGGAVLSGTQFSGTSYGAFEARENTTIEAYDVTFGENFGRRTMKLGTGSTALILRSLFRDSNHGAIRCNDCDLDVRRSSFVDNLVDSDKGGAIQVDGVSSEAIFRNTTFAGNQALGATAGAIALLEGADFEFNNVTITNNTAAAAGGLWVGHLAAPPEIANSILAGNSLSVGNATQDCGGDILSLGHNILGIADGCAFMTTGGDQSGTAASPLDPGLGSRTTLANLPIHRPVLGSPALDSGNNSSCEGVDQAGQSRPFDSGGGAICDIGAREETSPSEPALFTDGFETGDTSLWST